MQRKNLIFNIKIFKALKNNRSKKLKLKNMTFILDKKIQMMNL